MTPLTPDTVTSNTPTTHWDTCWMDMRHYACAQARVRELQGKAESDRRRLEALELEVLDWRAEHYGDMLALGRLDPAEFDKRIAGLNAERSAIAAGEEKP